MAKTITAPAEPAADTPALPAADAAAVQPDDHNFRAADSVSLDDAAPAGDTAPEETPPAERRPTRHDEQMAAIVLRRRERIEAERAEGRAQGIADDREPPAVAAAAPGAPAPAVDARGAPAAPEQPSQPSAAPAPAPAAGAPVRTHKILVRGNEIVMSDDDMRRAAELGVESEARIRHANAVLDEARRVAAASGQPIPGAGPSPPAAPPQAPAQAPPEDDRDAMRELARELLYGDEEKVVDALQRVVNRQPAQPGFDPEAMAREVYARLDSRFSLQTALQTFGSEYPEVVNDPDLATLTANNVQQLRAHYAQTATPRTELDLFREAGDATRKAVQRWSGGAPAPQPDPHRAPVPPAPQPGQSRITVKRNMPQAPAAAAAQPTPSAPSQKTGTDIVNWMRRARGQPVFA